MSIEGLPIILDKSTLHGLKPTEVETLSRYYHLILPPILLTEIMGDLYSKKKKDPNDNTEINPELVQILANKIITYSSCKNMDYRDLCVANLLGHNVYSDFRPCIEPTKSGTNSDGEVVAIIDDSVEMQMIHNWQAGKFDENDKEYAKAWRELVSGIDLNEYKAKNHGILLNSQATSLKEIAQELNNAFTTVNDANLQWGLISSFCDSFNVFSEPKREIETRWKSRPLKFSDFAPYAYYCFLIEQVFVSGLANNLIPATKKAKSYVDLQYAYYFPYTRVFSSNDKLHEKLWETFSNPEQQFFVNGEILKKDLNRLDSHWENLPEEGKNELRKCPSYPPILEDSFTSLAFEKMIALGLKPPREHYPENMAGRRTREEEKALVERLLAKAKIVLED